MAYTPAATPVDVILNGDYIGVYLLCDQMEVAAGRVDIKPITPKDVALPNLSGGYLLEVDGYADEEEDGWFFSSKYNTPIRIRSPKADEIVAQQYFYIRDYYNEMEDAVFNYNDYRKYIDIESFIRFFLVGEIAGNSDTFWSTYLYKDRNIDYFKFGPVWDMELTYDNDYRTFPINSRSLWLYEFGMGANGFRIIINRFLSDETIVSELKTTYTAYRANGAITKQNLLQVVDDYVLVLDQAQRLNFLRWNILDKMVHLNPQALGSYEAEVDQIKKFILERIDWMDNKLDCTVGNLPLMTGLSTIIVYAHANTIFIKNVFEAAHITLVDMKGRLLLSKSIRENASIQVSNGMYFVLITDSKGNKKTVKCLVTG